MSSKLSTTPTPFDFEAHRRASLDRFQAVRSLYSEFSGVVERILEHAFRTRGIGVASIQSRAKALESFGRKAVESDPADPGHPKYSDPLKQITDLAGVRVITFFPKTVITVDKLISTEFTVLERTNKADALLREERLGYQSIHHLVTLSANRTSLAEYGRFRDLVAEIQVRTVLQHAWAEIEHDIQYKSIETIPIDIRRRFMSLAGLLEIADREFQEIQNQDERRRSAVRASVDQGHLTDLLITPDALKTYLDKRLGGDDRMTSFSYDWTARLLMKLGFKDLQQLDAALQGYDDDFISRLLWGSRLGQLTRLEALLLASLGETYVRSHFFAGEAWFAPKNRELLEKLKANKIEPRGLPPGPKEGTTARA